MKEMAIWQQLIFCAMAELPIEKSLNNNYLKNKTTSIFEIVFCICMRLHLSFMLYNYLSN